MKKIVLLSSLGLVFILMLLMANGQIHKKKASSEVKDVQTNSAGDKFIGLNATTFFKGLARYRRYQYNAVNASLNPEMNMNGAFQDARSCWYSVAKIKDFIFRMEEYCRKEGLETSGVKLGIRFYYATYDENEYTNTRIRKSGSTDRLTPDYVGMHHTLFMVPTYTDNGTSTAIDFDPSYMLSKAQINTEDNPKQFLKPFRNTLPSTMTLQSIYGENKNANLFVLAAVSSINSGKTPSLSARNQGKLCPPNCEDGEATIMNYVDNLFPDGTITKD